MKIDEFLKKKIGFISLGCDKNRVDLEKMIFNIKNFGLTIVNNPSEANIIIVNTCSFLESARLESIETILEMSDYKSNNLEKLIVTGCLNELNYPDLQESMPEVDKFVNIKDNEQIVPILASLYNIQLNYNYTNDRVLTTPNHYAYLKVADGCNNFCTYCLIPKIRGRIRSESIEDLMKEAENLGDLAELILVAQDLTKYGVDLYGEPKIVELIRSLSSLENVEKIRLLYCYPDMLTDELIDEIKNNGKVIKYLDIPFQHADDTVLKRMNRKGTGKDYLNLVAKLKREIPSIAIRSTFIAGFPAESEEQFENLVDFIKKAKLTNAGFFAYSREEGTPSYAFPNQIDEKIKQKRVKKLYSTQKRISKKLLENYVGKEIEVLADGIDYDRQAFVGRAYFSAPEIDGKVYFTSNGEINQGERYTVKIEKTDAYDLYGGVVDEFTE